MDPVLLFGISSFIFGAVVGWWVKKLLILQQLDRWLDRLKRIED